MMISVPCGVDGNDVIIVDALDPDSVAGPGGAGKSVDKAVEPITTKPEFRKRLIEIHISLEQTIDTVSVDMVKTAGFDKAALDAARKTVKNFEQFIAEHRDEITALQILYSQPHRRRLTFKDIKELAAAIKKPPRRWTPDILWQAYERLGGPRSVASASGPHILTDLVTLIRLALHRQNELVPFAETVNQRFQNWLAQQSSRHRNFSPEQIQWLEMIRDHVATSLSVDADDIELSPFKQKGGLGKAHQLFGPDLPKVLDELNEVQVA
jgi:type I restriction enzyme, R subunit